MATDTIKLESEYVISLKLTSNPVTCNYIFKNPIGEIIGDYVDVLPASLSQRGNIVKQLKICIDPHSRLNKKNLHQESEKLRTELHKMYQVMRGEKEQSDMQEAQDEALRHRKEVRRAKQVLKNIRQPLIYIASIADWLTAGERINTVYCFCAYCSQVLLHNPISVIGIGDASSGKTYVEETALSLIPEKYIVNETGGASPAAFFNRAKEDPFFYDGKIVTYGDMGGRNDRENAADTMAFMKELQSEGYLKKPVSIRDENNNWVTEELELKGRCSLTYTTVPTLIDSQELSRSIVFSPRINNRDVFNKRSKFLSFGIGKTHERYEKIMEEVKLIPYMVECLREEIKDYTVLNPYLDVVLKFLQSSKYYKRDKDKYFGLMNAITVINFYQNPKYEFKDGTKILITSKDDVMLFVTLLKPYLISIALNVSPKAGEVYNHIVENMDKWKYSEENEKFLAGITARFYFEHQGDDKLSYQSVRKYFQELYGSGLLTIVGSEGRANVYEVNTFAYESTIEELFDTIEEDFEFIREELGKDVAEIIQNDELTYKLDIHNQHLKVERPPWQPKEV